MDPNKYGWFHKGPSKILMFLPSPQHLTFLSAHVFHESWFSSWFVSMQPSCLLYSHSFLTLLHLNNLVSYWRKALQYYLHFFRDTGTSPTEGLIPLLVSTCCFHDALLNSQYPCLLKCTSHAMGMPSDTYSFHNSGRALHSAWASHCHLPCSYCFQMKLLSRELVTQWILNILLSLPLIFHLETIFWLYPESTFSSPQSHKT